MKTNPLRAARGAGSAASAPALKSVRGTINYCVPIRERLHIDVRDFARTNMRFTRTRCRLETRGNRGSDLARSRRFPIVRIAARSRVRAISR
jgi:hypothetical protein